MNAGSADEHGAGPENLLPNGAPQGRVTAIGLHFAGAAGDASAGFWADTSSYWTMPAKALTGR
jgi:hypothetical protein